MLATGEFQERAAALGGRLLEELRVPGASLPGVKEIRGRGLWAGHELAAGMPPARAVCERLLNEELFVKDTQHTTIRLAPTLVITEAELELALERITKVLATWDPESLMLPEWCSPASPVRRTRTAPPGLVQVVEVE